MSNLRQDWHTNKQWAEWSQILEEALGWHLRVALRGLTIKKQKGGWQLRLQVHSKGKDLVAWVNADTYNGLWAQLGAAIQNNQIRWFPDRYPPNVGD